MRSRWKIQVWAPETWAAVDDDKEISALIADADTDVLEDKDAVQTLVNWNS